MKKTLANLVCTFGGIGHIPTAPGTMGSIAAAIVCALVLGPGDFQYSASIALGIALLSAVVGIWAIPIYSPTELDHKSIVIDEVSGLALCYALCFAGLSVALSVWGFKASVANAHWYTLTIGLLFFRVFDIWKPGVIRYYDQKKSPSATIIDDLLAGLFAAIPTTVIVCLMMNC
jgi:phosphatidylglycerophosphatase A